MRILITGSTGFIGSNLVRGLVAAGNHVVVYDLTPTLQRLSDIETQVKVVQGGILDSTKMTETIKAHSIERVVHLAAYLPEAAIREDPTRAIRVNGEGTNCVFEAARSTGVERVVYASTDAVNPVGPNPDSASKPTTLYGHLKLLNEAMGQHYYNQFGLDTIGLRFGMNYGPGGRLIAGELERHYISAFVHNMIETVASGQPIEMPFHESTSFHCTYVKDNTRAITLALEAGETRSRVFNVCGEKTYTLGDMAVLLKKILPGAEIRFGAAPMPSSLRTAEAQRLDCSAALKELGYAPQYTLEQGLTEYVEKSSALPF